VPFEATTPTGAAILAATASAFTDKFDFTPLKIGYGLGSRESSVPNVLRVFLGEKKRRNFVRYANQRRGRD